MRLMFSYVSEVTGASYNTPERAMADEDKLYRKIRDYKEAKKVSENPSYWDSQIRELEKLGEKIKEDRLKARVPEAVNAPTVRIKAHGIGGHSIELEFFKPYFAKLSHEQVDDLVSMALQHEFLEMECWEEIP